MKIQIKNFGPINFFECDLKKDFHLIVGENNIGKSYAVTIIYLIIKSIIESKNRMSILLDYFIIHKEELFEGISRDEFEKKLEESDISEIFCDLLIKILNGSLIDRFQEHFNGTYGFISSATNIYTDEKLIIKMQFEEASIEIRVSDDLLLIHSVKVKKIIKMKRVTKQQANKETSDSIIIHYTMGDDENNSGLLLIKNIIHFYIELIEEVTNDIQSIHFLPASRSGLYQALTAFGQIFAQLSKSRSFIGEKIEIPAIPVPLSDYFLELSSIEVNKNHHEANPINKVAEEIENSILKGKIEFDIENKKLFYTPTGSDLKLDIRTTSSMVSELSPIVSFLRHILTKPITVSSNTRISDATLNGPSNAKALIFIEEPEAHLHPVNQIKLLQSFASLLNCNIKLIITSHSNYIFNKINNLILSGEINTDILEAIVFKQEESGSIGKFLPLDELGIDDENFLDVTEDLYEEKLNLIAALNKND